MSDTELPTWLTKGAEVAIVHSTFDGKVTFAHIERLTPTQIVLDNGDRYRRGSDYAQLGVDRYKLPTCLVDPHSPHVVNRVARDLFRDVVRTGERITSGAGATIGQMDAAAVRDALADLADQINAARKELDRRAGL